MVKPAINMTNLSSGIMLPAYKDTPEGQDQRTVAHSGPAFLPWHREFIRRFELELQQVNDGTGITLPYWNWSEDSSKKWSDMAVWNVDCMGGNGNISNNFIVDTGPFQRWAIVDKDGSPLGLLTRDLEGSGVPLPTSAQVRNALTVPTYDSSNWDSTDATNSNTSFRKTFEGLHGNIHIWVGGSMFPMTSPNDPIFFLHHCYVDRVWDRWQIPHGFDYPADGAITTKDGQRLVGHNRNDSIYPWNQNNVSSVLPSLEMGVEYDPGNHAITAVATGSGNIIVFWIGPDGSVHNMKYTNQKWEGPWPMSGLGSASVPSGSITSNYIPQDRTCTSLVDKTR